MNFIEAVRALKEGKCKSISCWGPIVTIDLTDLRTKGLSVESILSEQWTLVNPVKQYEEVEVVRYMWKDHNGKEKISEVVPFLHPGDYEIIALKGTMKREIKPKVKHREDITDKVMSVGKHPVVATGRILPNGRNKNDLYRMP